MGKLFNFFSGTENRNDKGISKKKAEKNVKMGFARFFTLSKNYLGRISLANVLFLLVNLPIVFVLLGISNNFNGSALTASNPLYSQLYGAMQLSNGPELSTLYGVVGTSANITVVTTATKILLYSGILLVLTFGFANTGLFYILRGVARGDYVTTVQDFFGAIKKNLKQSFILGICDIVIIFLLMYDIIVYGATAENGSFMMLVFYYAVIVFSVIYYIMRFYLYTIIITFNMSIPKAFKNAFLLTSLGIKRNALGIVSTALLAFILYYFLGLLPSVIILLMFLVVPAYLAFIGEYCAYPVINKYMIIPYYEEHPEEKEEEPETESIFIDREE